MKKAMDKSEIIKKIVEIDVKLSNERYERTMTEEQLRKLRNKRNSLERRLYK